MELNRGILNAAVTGMELGQAITSDYLFERIAVRPPYFSNSNIRKLASGTVASDVPVQFVPPDLDGCITVAEAGRHLSNLGLCALAMESQSAGRNYYLAYNAIVRRKDFRPPTELVVGEMLRGTAEIIEQRGRGAKVRAKLFTQGGLPVYFVDVSYFIIPESAFERLHEDKHQEEPKSKSDNAHEGRFFQLPDLVMDACDEDFARATLLKVTPKHCAGHFPGYPAMPIASVAGGMIQTVDTMLSVYSDRTGAAWTFSHGVMEAKDLAFAGDKIHMVARTQERLGRLMKILVTARTPDGREVGRSEACWIVVESGTAVA